MSSDAESDQVWGSEAEYDSSHNTHNGSSRRESVLSTFEMLEAQRALLFQWQQKESNTTTHP